MSDVKAVRYLLANNASLTAVVPAARIMAGPLPQGTDAPALAITHVSAMPRLMVAAGSSQFFTARVQVTVLAPSYAVQRQVLKLVRDATQVDVKRADFKLDMLAPHLFMNFRVVDEHGRQLGHGRNLGALKAELGSQARGAFQALASLKLAQNQMVSAEHSEPPGAGAAERRYVDERPRPAAGRSDDSRVAATPYHRRHRPHSRVHLFRSVSR